MKTLYLHIGQAKTGTTAIQRYCYSSEDLLETHGLAYSRVNRDGYKINHKMFHFSFLREIGVEPASEFEVPQLGETIEALRGEVASSPCHSFLISFEGLAGLAMYQPRVIAALERLKNELSVEIKVIYYVRDPLDLLKSNYSQMAKKKGFIGPFVDFAIKAPEVIFDQTCSLSMYQDIFGKDKVIVKKFGDLKGGEFIADFFSTLSVDLTLTDDLELVNPSLKDTEIEFSRIAANYALGIPALKKEQFLFGQQVPDTSVWDGFVARLERANANHARLFSDCFDEQVNPVRLCDIFWHERNINLKPLLKHYMANEVDGEEMA